MCAPTIVTHGTPEQNERYLRPLFTNEEIWCQLFSEPGAGRTWPGCRPAPCVTATSGCSTGRRCGRRWRTSPRSGSSWRARNPDVPKHKGMTAFLVDMKAPGVEVRPLFQITGEAEFNEVFFSDVRMPDAARIGGEGDGWRVAVTTLMNERVSIGGAVSRGVVAGRSRRPSGSGRNAGRAIPHHTPSPSATASCRATSVPRRSP